MSATLVGLSLVLGAGVLWGLLFFLTRWTKAAPGKEDGAKLSGTPDGKRGRSSEAAPPAF